MRTGSFIVLLLARGIFVLGLCRLRPLSRPQGTTAIGSASQSPEREVPELPVWMQRTNKLTIDLIKLVLSVVIPSDRPYARFYALETIARVPYFSYTSVLHLYETFGWLRKSEYIKVHFAESWNELHHLKIMEELGGNREFSDRFIAQHMAFFYYWLVVGVYIAAPAVACEALISVSTVTLPMPLLDDLNKNVELHAYNTYRTFIEEHAEELRGIPAPQVAKDYYGDAERYMFDAFQSDRVLGDASGSASRRVPVIETLHDVFCNIRDDEMEHADTMRKLQRDVTLSSRGLVRDD